MKRGQVSSLTVTEASANIIAATTIGFILGRLLSAVAMSVLTNLLEMPLDTSLNLSQLLVLISISIFTVYLGTKISVTIMNKKKITAILKGD